MDDQTPTQLSSTSTQPPSSSSEPSSFQNPDPYSNPLFLHPADSSSLTLVSEKLVGEPNYNLWSRSVIKALTTKNKLGFIYGEIPQPSTDHPDFGSWSRCNALVATWLANSVSSDIGSQILYLDDAHAIWQTLETRFKQSNVSKIFSVEQRIDNLRQGSLDLNSFFTKLNALWEELNNYEPYPVCSCGGCSCQANMKLLDILARRNVVKFLMKLNDSFTQARRHILMIDPLPSLAKVYNLISQEEHHRSSILSPSDSVVFQASSSFPRPKHSFSLNPTSKPRPQCTHCGLLGHTISRCYKLHGYPSSTRNHPSPSTKPPLLPTPKHFSPSRPFASVNLVTRDIPSHGSEQPAITSASDPLAQAQVLFDQFQSRLKTLGISSTDSALTAPTPTAPSAPTSGIFPSLPVIFSALEPYFSFPPSVWILDTGASSHICCDSRLFSDLHCISPITITLPNGDAMSVSFSGSVILSEFITLTSVLYVPCFRFNLLRVSALTQNTSLTVCFSHDSYLIQDPTRGLTIGKGSRSNNLYIMAMQGASTASYVPASLCTAVSVSSDDLWHLRLGHPSTYRIQGSAASSQPKFSVSPGFYHGCNICPLAKQPRLSFPFGGHRCSASFDVIHLDVWGPFHVETYDGYKYFFTLVDDFSRLTWVYLLHSKSDVLSKFSEFLAYVQTQFQTTVKQIRSDNAPELAFTKLLQAKGIHHQFSCPYTPQQNSVVERKHRHILNVARLYYFSPTYLLFIGENVSKLLSTL
ncbi:PREDICTED: uncharacterized protein LOC104815505 isoform X1 [Tarenaya hassleriana]|uniref:uncharacterized protein LOC104815505 isoform X2 n=1 Tax=Tarenaya hassleriana TaxID=28532 RepID=UPI00053C9E93|nr:PREDICTED: uncharacterized protein LOC104815505 isoform X2 [Tarenaya hassleriana]XP_010542221.1 PREDICTED: uncharacterized protein LOC104815505 isoform X1 [Tarenaya hassleriana]